MPFLLIASGFVKRGLGSAFAFLSKLSPAQLALLVVTVAGIGFHIADQRHIRRVERHDLATSRALGKEQATHAADIARWKAASEAATALNKATLARVTAQQATITERVSNDYQSQLADLLADHRARLDRVRHPSPINQRPANGNRAPPVPASPSGPDGPNPLLLSPDQILRAQEIELQLMALQNWVSRQAAVDPNAKP